uniref:Uncharacterized protein n=1 Tax=Yersinia enterocolitica W22703 TaxID=913028 RepID=F4N2Q6_YEREN|nr:unknown protein [Yersinia enterocolitica W22703]
MISPEANIGRASRTSKTLFNTEKNPSAKWCGVVGDNA